MTRFGIALTTIALVASTFVPDSHAQRIRDYGDSAESQYGASGNAAPIPGAPARAPQQGDTQGTAQPGQDGAQEGDDAADYDTGVTVFRRSGGSAEELEQLDLKPEEMYRGVIPGTRDDVDHLKEAKDRGTSGANQVMWIGFQPREQTTRVFIQTAREANYDMSREGNAITLTFSNTKLSARNFGRFIDTSFFKRNVTRIESKKIGRDQVKVTITLRESEQPRVNSTTNYVYLDFSERVFEDKKEETSDAAGASDTSDE